MSKKRLSEKEMLAAITSGSVGQIIPIKPEGVLVNEKGLIVYYNGDHELEATMRLDKKNGLIISVTWFEKDKVEVDITKTVNGCPGGMKADFRKIYKRQGAKSCDHQTE